MYGFGGKDWFQAATCELIHCLPDMYWGVVFGKAYSDLFSMDKLLSAPAYHVEQLSDDVVYIQLSETLGDVLTNFDEVQAVREKVKAHLGNAFGRSELAYPIVTPIIVDATIIQTAGSKQRQAIEVDEEGQVSGQTTPSKDQDARWTKKNGLYRLGYKQHTRTDEEGYIEKLHITPANAHECKHLSPLLEGLPKGTTVYADKGYDSEENRQHLEEHRLLDGIMRKAHRKHPLSEAQTKRNRYLSKTRYVVEQSFGTLHRKFRYARAAYFGLIKVSAQSHLKAMCLNLLKAANRLSAPVAA